ncbi:hypothetical protein JTB14_023706 [Gonioctena quinquepunctata]|nr:hypothetical protein JTB14_023706 [Gonioctena quinquepunctata]
MSRRSIRTVRQERGSIARDEELQRKPITLKVRLEKYQNIVAQFSASDIRTSCSWCDETIGQTIWIPVIDGDNIFIDQSFFFTLDKNSAKDMDKLLSLPMVLTVSQMRSNSVRDLYGYLQINDEMARSISFEKIIIMYEAFTDQKISKNDISDKTLRKTKKSKKSRLEKTGKTKEKLGNVPGSRPLMNNKRKKSITGRISIEAMDDVQESIIYGMCTIDFIPLFQGKTSFSESLLIRPLRKFDDEKMIPYKAYPKITLTVSIEGDLDFVNSIFMNITLETIHNIPSTMKPEMDYRIGIMLPRDITQKIPILFTNPVYKSDSSAHSNKCWPGMPKLGLDANTTTYKSNSDEDKTVSALTEDITPYLKRKSPKLCFNMIKRNMIFGDRRLQLETHMECHRKLVLDFHMSNKYTRKSIPNLNVITSPTLRSSIENIRKMKQHYLIVLDISPLLYPGVRRVRLASPLVTHNAEEFLKYGGVEEHMNTSFRKIIPSKDGSSKEGIVKKDKNNRGKDRDTDKSSKSSAKSKDKVQAGMDLKTIIPPKPKEEAKSEPSVPVLNEKGEPCFLTIEIEFSKPIVPKNEIEDLRERIHELFQDESESTSKVVLSNRLAESHYKQMLIEIIQDLDGKFRRFSEEHPWFGDRTCNSPSDFVNFLKSIGAYQTYSTSLLKALTLVTTKKFKFDISERNGNTYQAFIGNVFIHLTSGMDDTLNELLFGDINPLQGKNFPIGRFFFCKEAMEMRDTALAERYLLEGICMDKQNPDSWFDYGIYFLEIKDADRAFECFKEALIKNPNHRYSLMALGILLDNKGQKEEAETCFLNLLVQAPKWLEAWGVLYLFYQKYVCYEGMEVALEMAKKYPDEAEVDYFTAFEDLAWASKICPKTIFFRTAMVLLKMRLFGWVEIALAEEMNDHCGLVHYLLAAVCYYKGLYSHALEHIEQSKTIYGFNYAVANLSGHCLLALDERKEAKKHYYHAMGEFERPNDMHLFHLNISKILEYCGQDQESRKFILLACKYNPTPYTWLKAGLLYLQENDLLSAEECFSEGNERDPQHAVLWGNLCLVNIKLGRPYEAGICYEQALHNNLEDVELLKAIEKSRKSHENLSDL